MKRALKAAAAFLVVLLAALAAAAAWIAVDLKRFAERPAGTSDRQVVVAVESGEAFTHLAERMQKAGIITDQRRFRLLARIKGADKRLKAGEYELTLDMTPLQVLDELVRGKVLLHALTVPEGWTNAQIAAAAQRLGLADAERFTALVSDPQTAAGYGLQAATLEGYLFPDTYYFPKGVGARPIVDKMVGRFEEQFGTAWRQRASELGLSVHQVVTLASIVEKETGDPAERPLIASVFYNRLRRKMRLESDPTVIYGIPDFDGNLTRVQLHTPTAYNTYVIQGLPPGPIANPGRAALEATLYPASSDYLYFVARGDGTHVFSTNLGDHNQAVRQYQLRGPARKADRPAAPAAPASEPVREPTS